MVQGSNVKSELAPWHLSAHKVNTIFVRGGPEVVAVGKLSFDLAAQQGFLVEQQAFFVSQQLAPLDAIELAFSSAKTA